MNLNTQRFVLVGWTMPGKKVERGYRYGFNGMERDDELKGDYNSYDFGARLYDTRVARWLAVDPLAGKYPSLSPYNFVNNRPTLFVDYDGRDFGVLINHDTETITIIATYESIATRQQNRTFAEALAKWNSASGTLSNGYTVNVQLTGSSNIEADEYGVALEGNDLTDPDFIENSILKSSSEDLKTYEMKARKLNISSIGAFGAKPGEVGGPVGVNGLNVYGGNHQFHEDKETYVSSNSSSTFGTHGGYTFMGRNISMVYIHSGPRRYNFANSVDRVGHEVGHTLGLADFFPGVIEPRRFCPKGSIMDYGVVGDGRKMNTNHIISMVELSAVLRFAHDFHVTGKRPGSASTEASVMIREIGQPKDGSYFKDWNINEQTNYKP